MREESGSQSLEFQQELSSSVYLALVVSQVPIFYVF